MRNNIVNEKIKINKKTNIINNIILQVVMEFGTYGIDLNLNNNLK